MEHKSNTLSLTGLVVQLLVLLGYFYTVATSSPAQFNIFNFFGGFLFIFPGLGVVLGVGAFLKRESYVLALVTLLLSLIIGLAVFMAIGRWLLY